MYRGRGIVRGRRKCGQGSGQCTEEKTMGGFDPFLCWIESKHFIWRKEEQLLIQDWFNLYKE